MEMKKLLLCFDYRLLIALVIVMNFLTMHSLS